MSDIIRTTLAGSVLFPILLGLTPDGGLIMKQLVLTLSLIALIGCTSGGSGGGSGSGNSNTSTSYDLSNLKFRSISKASVGNSTYMVGSREISETEKYARIVRLDENGVPDSTFAGNLSDISELAEFDASQFTDIAEQSDHKVIAVGTGWKPTGSVGLVIRFNDDGTLDDTFGTNGVLKISIPDSDPTFSEAFVTDIRLAIRPNDKIVVMASYIYYTAQRYYGFKANTYQFEASGTLDTSFNNSGFVITEYISRDTGKSFYGKAMALLPDGKIVIAGSSFEGSYSPHLPWVGHHFTFYEYNLDGSLNTAFGTNGMVRLDSTDPDANESSVYTLAIQSDGKILGAGYHYTVDNNIWYHKASIVRLNTDGSLDSNFATGGLFEVGVKDRFLGFSDLKVTNGKAVGLLTPYTDDSYIYKITDTGSLDQSFGSNGILKLTNLRDAYGSYFGMSLDSLSNIWVGGTVNKTQGFNVLKISN